MKFNYNLAFNRNIGVVTELEQRTISNAVIALAGVGGIGGSTLLCLVRMGFQNFKLADLDSFDLANSNRQAGANLTTYDLPKVEVMKKMALEINPLCKIKVFDEGVQQHNVDSFLKDVDIVLDCIDFFCLSARELLNTKAYEYKIPVFMSAPMGLSATVIGFSPNTIRFEDYFNFKKDDDKFVKILKFLVGLAPRATHSKYVDFSVERIKKMKTGPSIASAVNLGVSLLTNEVLMELTKRRKPIYAPKTLQIDLYTQKYKLISLKNGNNSIFQLVKIFLAKKKYASARNVFNDFIV